MKKKVEKSGYQEGLVSSQKSPFNHHNAAAAASSSSIVELFKRIERQRKFAL